MSPPRLFFALLVGMNKDRKRYITTVEYVYCPYSTQAKIGSSRHAAAMSTIFFASQAYAYQWQARIATYPTPVISKTYLYPKIRP